MPHKDPEARRAYMRAYKKRANAKGTIAINDRAKNANLRARAYGVEGVLTAADVRAVLHPGASCVYCGTNERLTIDHRVPMARGGANTRKNLVPACLSCNIRKYNSDHPWGWARDYEACVICGTTSTKHCAHGQCMACHARETSRKRREALRLMGLPANAKGVRIRKVAA